MARNKIIIRKYSIFIRKEVGKYVTDVNKKQRYLWRPAAHHSYTRIKLTHSIVTNKIAKEHNWGLWCNDSMIGFKIFKTNSLKFFKMSKKSFQSFPLEAVIVLSHLENFKCLDLILPSRFREKRKKLYKRFIYFRQKYRQKYKLYILYLPIKAVGTIERLPI